MPETRSVLHAKLPLLKGIGCFLFITVFTLYSISSIYGSMPMVDASIFSSVGLHIVHGKILYKDVWDNKPPLIYLLNALSHFLPGNSITGIRCIETIFALCSTSLIFLITRSLFRSTLAALTASILFSFMFFDPLVLEGGNLTEEYATPFWLFALYLLIGAKSETKQVTRLRYMIAGFSIGVACWFKEPYALLLLTLQFYLLDWKSLRTSLSNVAWFVMGVIIISALILSYLAATGAFVAWVDTLSYNLTYSRHTSSGWSLQRAVDHAQRFYSLPPVSQNVLFLLLMLCFIVRAFNIRKGAGEGYRIILILSIVSCVSVLVSGSLYGHYYMQVIPALSIAAGGGAAWAISNLAKGSNSESIAGWIFVGVAGFIVTVFPDYRNHLIDLRSPSYYSTVDSNPIVEYINSHEKSVNDTMWVADATQTHYYIQCDMVSPCKFIGIIDHWFLTTWQSTGTEKWDNLMDDLADTKPRYIIVSDNPPSHAQTESFETFAEQHYRPVVESGSDRLLERINLQDP